MPENAEFTVGNAYRYDRRSAARWIFSHVFRYKRFLFSALACQIVSICMFTLAPVLTGQAVDVIMHPGPDAPAALVRLALGILAALVIDGAANMAAAFCAVNISNGIAASARTELYASLLGKSQAVHDRLRIGDVMARATDDASQLSDMVMPGAMLIMESTLAIIVPLIYIAFVRWEMLLVPLLFLVGHVIALRAYVRKLNPVTREQRQLFGKLNAGLEETISGIQVVKASAQEMYERRKYTGAATRLRGAFVQQGEIEARYLPLLLYALAVGLSFLQSMLLYRQGLLNIPQIVMLLGLVSILRFPTFISIFTFSLVQSGVASAERILQILKTDTDVDENTAGYDKPMRGEITFDRVGFTYEGAERPLLREVSFHIQPGQTVAIVGQTGSGKTSLVQLVSRTYEATSGRVLIDGVDVREWSLDALRSQVGKIEQDVFLFSRSIAENIAYGKPGATQAQIEQAAQGAQAHDFILGLAKGYGSEVGERGVMLSGGQRQRIALARAFLSDPRILILDDSTSAIDSATEDQIQRAIQHAARGRTTVLITHRLSQIRWADVVVVLKNGRVEAAGGHDELLATCEPYRRIFVRLEQHLGAGSSTLSGHSPMLPGDGANGKAAGV
ncbi:MAG: ABC transporter ATP-binding protein [Anaerolineales bacterium]